MGLYDDLPAAKTETSGRRDGDDDDDKGGAKRAGTQTRTTNADADVAVDADGASKRAAWSTLASSARGSASKEARKPTGAMLRAQASAMRAAKARRERERLELFGSNWRSSDSSEVRDNRAVWLSESRLGLSQVESDQRSEELDSGRERVAFSSLKERAEFSSPKRLVVDWSFCPIPTVSSGRLRASEKEGSGTCIEGFSGIILDN